MLINVINKQVKDIVKNKLLLAVVLSISTVMMFADCLAAETNTVGMNSSAFSLLIGIVVIFSFNYIFRYLLKLNIDKVAIFNTLGIKKEQILLFFSIVIFISSILIFFAGSVLGSGIFIFAKQKEVLPYVRHGANGIFFVWLKSVASFSIYLIIALAINYHKLYKKSIRELFDEKVKVRTKILNYKLSIAMYILSIGLFFICAKGLIAGGKMQQIAINGGMAVLILHILSFYFVFYGTIFKMKNLYFQKKTTSIFLYNILTKDIVKNTWISIVLSISLIFSFTAYTSGNVFLKGNITFFSDSFKAYFSIVEMCIAIIILIIYFIVLAMDIVSELNLFKKDMSVLFLLGYSYNSIDKLLINIIFLKFLIPSLAFWVITLSLFLNIIGKVENLLRGNYIGIIVSFALLYNTILVVYAIILYREYNCKHSLVRNDERI